MLQRRTHQISLLAPFICSALALTIVIIAIATGWQRNLPDEGAAAHLFQLLIGIQPLLIILCFATAAGAALSARIRTIFAQLAAVAIPVLTAAAFGL